MTAKTEVAHLADQLHRAYHGTAWHGPAFRELLKDVSAEWAAARPIVQAHSIWELVLHVTVWKRVVLHRLQGKSIELTPAADWPEVPAVDAELWKKSLAELEAAHQELHTAVAHLAEHRLHERVPGRDHTVYVMLHGAAQHDAYHAGQIALLKKAR
jgi:uncharacterized damage-inducible protein DinB